MHTAGCSIGCAGCFNADLQDAEHPDAWEDTAESVAMMLVAAMYESGADGVTISGGEPTDQMDELVWLLRDLRERGVDSIVLYTGRTVEWLRRDEGWRCIESEGLVDVVIDGPFKQHRLATTGQRGSENQRVLVVTGRHERAEFDEREVEVQIAANGRIVLLGFPDPEMLAELAGEED